MAKRLEQQETLSASLIAGSDVVYDYVCQSCNEDGKQLEAVGFCVDCSEFLCDDCYRCHLKPKLTRHHKLLDIEEAKKDTNLSGCLDICTEHCSQHRGEIIKYFCSDHGCLGCGVCVNLDHRNCRGVQYIPKIAKNTGNGEEFSSLINELDKLLLQTKEIANTSLGNKLKSQDIFDKALDHVKQVRKGVNEAFNKLEKEIETEATKMKKADIMKMEENIKYCNNIQTKATKLSTNMKEMQNKEQYCNLFVAMAATKTQISSIQKSLKDMSKDTAISNYLFQPSEQLDNFLKHGGRLGKLFMKDDIRTKVTLVGEISMRIKTKATKVGEINVQMDSGSGISETCDIRGMALITGGRLAIADNMNKKVKLIDIKQSKVISEYRLPCYPWGIITTNETDEIAVSQPYQHMILLFRVRDDRLYEHRKLMITGTCYGIACIKDTFVVSSRRPDKVEIIDTKGNVLQTIVEYEDGQKLSNTYSIAVSREPSTIYIPDCGKNIVTRMSLSGQDLGVYNDSELKGARSATVCKGGEVYICGENSHTIHQVTADCKKISILLTEKDGLKDPISLCYDDNNDRLYVGQNDNNTLLVYQLL